MRKIYTIREVDNIMKKFKSTNTFNHDQLAKIRKGLLQNLDVSIYAKPEFDYIQMNEIREGLLDNLDVSLYNNIKYNYRQMREIIIELKYGLDVSKYAVPKLMDLIKECLCLIHNN